MEFTARNIERFRDFLRANPLEKQEIQRVQGMGELYIALVDTEVDENKYTYVYELFIDDVGYKFYSKNTNSSSAV